MENRPGFRTTSDVLKGNRTLPGACFGRLGFRLALYSAKPHEYPTGMAAKEMEREGPAVHPG
jgi:hypothetical protein